MKKMNSILAMAAAVLAMTLMVSCEKEIRESEKNAGEQTVTPAGKQITITATIPDTPETRVAFEQETGNVKLTWETGDKIIIVDQNNVMDKQTFTLVSGDGEATATFSGTEPSNTSSVYTIFYAGNAEAYTTTDAVNNKSYADQVQVGNGNTSHLAFTAMLTDVDAYDHFVFSADWASAHSGNLVVNSIYKFYFKLPAAVTNVSEVRLNAPAAIFYTTNSNGSTTSEIGVSLLGVDVSASEQVLTAYAMASDETVSMAAATYTVTVVGTSSSWVKQFTTASAGTFGGGKTHVIQLNDSNWAELPGKGTEAAPFLLDTPEELQMVSPLLVINGAKRYFKMGGDITFDATKSAAYVPVANFFNAEFDGNKASYAIKSYTGTKPLFTAIASTGKVKNLSVDSSCSFTFTHPNDAEYDCGAIAGVLDGELNNVSVAANVSLGEVASVTQLTSIGGLVGCATTGTISDSDYSGLLSTPAGFTSTAKAYIGGLVGHFSGAGSITGSNFKGAINNAAQITSSDDDNPYLIIGGVAGYVDGGASVTSCATTTDHADEASAYDGFTGIIVNKTTVAYHSAVGGIVGELNNGTVSSCTNAATIALSIYRSKESARFMKTGGIVGKSNANGGITGCTNNGSVQHRSNPKYQDLGGIAGYNAGTMSNCTNNAPVNQMTSGQSTKAGRYVRLGGVIGENVANNKVSNIHNTAAVQISSMEDNEDGNSTEYLGGVVGYNKGTIVGGDTKDITNSGEVYHSPYFSNQFAGYYVGGIAGLTTAAIKNAKNTGRSYFRWQGTTLGASKVYIGGIAGKAEGASSVIENCENTVDSDITNSAQVYLYLPGNASHKDNYVGGIVGLSEATNPVKNCTNGGEVRTASGASTTPVTGIMMGGIIGKMTGSGEVNNADNSGRVRINFIAATDGHSGNYLGGIVGYVVNASSVTVTGCDNGGNVDVSNNKSPVSDLIISGVVGRMDAPGTISNCKNNGGAINMAITAANVAMNNLYVGGILGKTEQDVTVSGCSNTGAISGGNSSSAAGNSFYIGGIAAYMKGASKILDCSNTGSTVSTQTGNNDTIGSTTLTGGIVGFVEGTSETPIEIGGTTGCTINTSASLNATRGWIGGVAAYAKYAQISKCTVSKDIDAAARGAGGIVGKAEYCTVSGCSFSGDKVKSNQIQSSTGHGGIVGYLDNSTIDGCSCYATKFYNSNSQPFGGIVGKSVSNNTIQNCHYKSTVEGPTSGTAATAQVAGSGTFSGSNNLADL
ncbi:MAG: hypothetical protein J5632_02635 [Bacteroidales bacterium]|nr:hypothetical protein [Bacteroidales bacterium]